jgi:hypothetical protein
VGEVALESYAVSEHPTLWSARALGFESVGALHRQDVLGVKGFARQFSQTYRVDKFCCCAYTLAVVLMPSGMVVKGKSSGPGTMKDGSGQ